MKTNKVFAKLAIGITILILTIEGALLFFSVSKKKEDLFHLQRMEVEHYGTNNIITDKFVENELNRFTTNILYLTIIISTFVVAGTSSVYYRLIGKFLSKITKHNRTNSFIDSHFLDENLPNDEIGELIISREKMLKSLDNKIEENKTLTRMLAHDIGNSLAVAMGNAETLLKQIERNETSFIEYKLSKILKACRAQKDLIDRVRHLEAMGSKKQQLVMADVSLNDLIKDSIELFEDRLKEKQLEINFKANIDDSNKVYIDDVLVLNNVINNLISNAIKFSEKKSIIEIITFQDKPEFNSFEIKDFGMGIPQNLLDKIFLPNAKTNRPGTNGETGTGFGLPLAFSTISLLNGKIKVASKNIEQFPSDHWTKFRIDLPTLSRK